MAKIIGTTQYEIYKLGLFERKKEHAITSEMSWCNIPRRAGSDYCVNVDFPGTFANFCLKYSDQKK